MRHVTDAGLALIKRFESFSPTIYVCPAGYPTIGYGHVVKEGERERFANGIGKDEAEDLLRRDAAIAVTIRRGPSSPGREGVACLGIGASSGVCTGARDGAYGAGSCSHRPRAAAAVQL